MGVFDRKGPDGECADEARQKPSGKQPDGIKEVPEAELKNQLKKPKNK